MRIVATVEAVDTGNCIGAQVRFIDYLAKVSEHAQVYAVMLKAVYRAAAEFVDTLPEDSRLVFAESMAASLGGDLAEIYESMSQIDFSKMNAADLNEVIENPKKDIPDAE